MIFKSKYRNDYKTTTFIDAAGHTHKDTVYTGSYYVLPFDEGAKRRSSRVNLAFGLIIAGLYLAMGMVNPPSSRTAYVVMPYVILFLPIAYFIFGAVRYMGCRLRMENGDYQKGLVRMKHSAWGMLGTLAVSAVLDILYIIIHLDAGVAGKEVVYLAFHFVLAAIIVVYGKLYDRLYGGIKVE